MLHKLKTWPPFFKEILNGNKLFELRKDDRGFHAGDILRLMEWDNKTKQYTGRIIEKKVTYVLSGWGLEKDYVCMSLSPAPSDALVDAVNIDDQKIHTESVAWHQADEITMGMIESFDAGAKWMRDRIMAKLKQALGGKGK